MRGFLRFALKGNDSCNGSAGFAAALRSGIRASMVSSCVASGVVSIGVPTSSGAGGTGFASSCGRIPANTSAALRIRSTSRSVGLARSPLAMFRCSNSLVNLRSRLT